MILPVWLDLCGVARRESTLSPRKTRVELSERDFSSMEPYCLLQDPNCTPQLFAGHVLDLSQRAAEKGRDRTREPGDGGETQPIIEGFDLPECCIVFRMVGSFTVRIQLLENPQLDTAVHADLHRTSSMLHQPFHLGSLHLVPRAG